MSAGADDIHALAAARVGQILHGKWRLDALLGVGGSACVYAATHRNGKRGAVKLLRPELAANEEARRRFLREGYVANRIGHRGAVAVLDDDATEDGTVFLVMELLEGQTLEDYARGCPNMRVSPSDAAFIADKLLDVLAAAHDKGIVHRDLKPENVFLTTDGDVKILDFGTARMRETGPGTGRMTEVGHIMGTPAFMPPEQALGHNAEIDGRTDLWALGAIMFYVLTGKLIHNAETLNKVLLSAMTQQAPPLGAIAPDVPRELCAIVDQALVFQKDKRWADARRMQHALRSVRQMLPAAPPFLAARTAGVGRHGGPMTGHAGLTRDAFEPASGKGRRIAMAVGGLFALGALTGAVVFAVTKPARPATSSAALSAEPKPPVPPKIAATTPPAPQPASAASTTASATAVVPKGTSNQTNSGSVARPATATTKPTKPTSTTTTGGSKDIFSQW